MLVCSQKLVFQYKADMPGFGRSGGQRHSSRTERHWEHNGTCQTVHDILDFLQVKVAKKCLILG